jgi:hypothetical protein
MILILTTGKFGFFDEIFVSLFELYCFCVHNSQKFFSSLISGLNLRSKCDKRKSW